MVGIITVKLPVWSEFVFIADDRFPTAKELGLHNGLPVLKENGLELITLEDFAFLELAGGMREKERKYERELSFSSVLELPAMSYQQISTASVSNIWVAESCVYNPNFPEDVLIARPPFNPITNVLYSLKEAQLADPDINPLVRSIESRERGHLQINGDEYAKIRDNASSDPSEARKTGVFLVDRRLFDEGVSFADLDLSVSGDLTDRLNQFLFGDYASPYIKALGDYSPALSVSRKNDVNATNPIANQMYIGRIGPHNQIDGHAGFLITKEMGVIGVRRGVSMPGMPIQIFYVPQR